MDCQQELTCLWRVTSFFFAISAMISQTFWHPLLRDVLICVYVILAFRGKDHF